MIGVGLKEPRGAGDANTYQNYIAITVAFVSWLCEQGYGVKLLTGDFSYEDDLLSAIKGHAAVEGQIVAEPFLTVEAAIRELEKTDLIVSPRFHSLVLGLMLYKPVIALSDHSKLDSLMGGLGLAEYCLPLPLLDNGSLTELFQQLQNNAESLKVHIRDRPEKYREALDKEYALAFAKAEGLGLRHSPASRGQPAAENGRVIEFGGIRARSQRHGSPAEIGHGTR